ncbi:MerR family transcriptional regulator [Acinetobacter sp. S40]|uniref:MerR family transcriptional regulator n=1 Tax=unclassified Acinetobacter TaxID=196816 RepID=UPI00190A0F12|nr:MULTISPECIES: MerR family transcriptional regulator [unclassified Acinetobacter]MBJ9985323.1 MerR family transcriptional regulator [Acinetobacter sp. S40]MBK0063885.1 MerR family transcriptional regulator [Acinetobacter sp. S55]MBK0067047.1 MerR family transcriptional regulator [Acinetobacter sp. S54]
MLTIGKLAKQANLNVETIRYYQRIGLMRTPETIDHYRYYNDQDKETLSFIQKAKDAGLQLTEIKELLQLQLDDREQVRHVIEQRLEKIDLRIQELQGLKQRLSSWIDECKSTETDCCPILMDLKQKTNP